MKQDNILQLENLYKNLVVDMITYLFAIFMEMK